MSDIVIRLAAAFDYAARKHAGQTRKGARAEPYVNHVAEVAALLAEATGGKDPELVIAGLLHDILEDSDATESELARLFGAEAASVVAEVTDPEDVTEERRRRHQVEAAPGLSVRARMLKIADKTSNLREMADDPPPGWTDEEIRAYVAWGADVVAGCRGLNAFLEDAFDGAHARCRARFGER